MITREEVDEALRGLRQIAKGEVFETHEVRRHLAVARKLEKRLRRWQEAIWFRQRTAERAFLEGWPKVKDAPWVMD